MTRVVRLLMTLAFALPAGCATPYKPTRPGSELKPDDFPLPPATFLDANSRAPRPVKMRNPAYPFELRKQKVSGTVIVDIYVDKGGHVAGVEIVSSPHPLFDPAVIGAVNDWVFEPAIREGRPVNSRVRYPIEFNL